MMHPDKPVESHFVLTNAREKIRITKQQLAGKKSWSSGLHLQQNLLNLANFIEEYKKF
jgi:hypothetical protein